MPEVVLLDAGPLGMASNPRPTEAILAWLGGLLTADVEVLVPEVADYEIRRELLRIRSTKGIRRLDRLKNTLGFLEITTTAMLQAAEFWAEARRRGRPTSHQHALDADAILAGQAATLRASCVDATTNVKHLSRFVTAKLWHEIAP
jgi:predicted nucleic acid-binding protein